MEQLEVNGAILALDVGKRRIGIAVTDQLKLTAQGLPTLERTRIRDDMRYLSDLANARNVALFVIGRPLHLSGTESRQSEYTREFGERLRVSTGIPVVYWDERFTTVEATRLMRDAGATLEQRKKAVDRLSAVLILESYMEAERIQRGWSESADDESDF